MTGERVGKRDQKRKVNTHVLPIFIVFVFRAPFFLECQCILFYTFETLQVPGRISEAPPSPAQSNKRPRKLKASDL